MRQVVRGKRRRTRLKFIGKIDKQDTGWQGSNAKEQDEARKTTHFISDIFKEKKQRKDGNKS